MVKKKLNPLISVIILVYNAEKFLHICLEYLTNQTYPCLEFILVDDGSIDNTPAIYKNYAKKDKRFKIIRQENLDPANARNKSLANATGEYVHFHDCDDFVEQDYYKKMVDAIKLNHYAKTIATAPGAKYHCVSVPTSLGKNAKKIMQGRGQMDSLAST